MDKWNITTVNKVSYGQIEENCIKEKKTVQMQLLSNSGLCGRNVTGS